MKILPRTVPAGEVVERTNDANKILRRHVEISIERETFTVVHQPGSSFAGLCKECGHAVLMLSADMAAATSGATPREIYRGIDAGKLHFYELSTGKVFLCSVSLKSLREPEALRKPRP